MAVTIYHNPDCGTSRNVLALLQQAGLEPQVIEYLKTPPSAAELMALVAQTDQPLRSLLREKGTPFAALGLGAAIVDDAVRLAAIAAHPILLNRPLVETPMGVRLCRPSDVVLDLLPSLPPVRIDKEEGAPFLRDRVISGSDAGLLAALAENHLPTEDCSLPGRRFFAYAMLDGTPAGYAGYERSGADVLLRSIVVAPEFRGARIGRNLVPLLLYRAAAEGATRAWLFTQTAETFFANLGFKPVDRAQAPEAILATAQAKSLCPASAPLMFRTITF